MSLKTIIDRLGLIVYRGRPSYQVISSASLAVLTFFYVYSSASHLNLRIYPLVNRVTYYTNFQVYVISEYVDHIILGCLLLVWAACSLPSSKVRNYGLAAIGIAVVAIASLGSSLGLDIVALASLPAISVLFVIDGYLILKAKKKKKIGRRLLRELDYKFALNSMALVGVILGGITLALTTIAVFTGEHLPASSHIRMYAYDIFLVLSSFSPVLLLLLIVCVPLRLLINALRQVLSLQKGAEIIEDHNKAFLLTSKKKITILSFIVLLSALLVLIPHTPTINKTGQQVGVDTGAYVTWINELDVSRDPQDLLNKAFVGQINGDRPLSTIFLFVLHKITYTDPFHTVEFSPFILAPALVIVVYLLTRQMTQNDITPLIAAFLTAVSFHTLIGIYAGYYANWIALILGYLSFTFLFRFLKIGGSQNLLLFGILLLLTLFSHVYTWSVLAIASGIFLAVLLVKPAYLGVKRKNASLLLLALLCTVVIDVARTSILQTSSGIDRDVRLAGAFTGFEQFVLRWNNLDYTTTTYLGGLFANFIIFGLGLYWLVKADIKKQMNVFIIVFLSMGILPFLIGEYTIQARVFYDIPFQIPAAVALTYFLDKKNLLRPTAIWMWLTAIAVIAVSNYYLVTPLK